MKHVGTEGTYHLTDEEATAMQARITAENNERYKLELPGRIREAKKNAIEAQTELERLQGELIRLERESQTEAK